MTEHVIYIFYSSNEVATRIPFSTKEKAKEMIETIIENKAIFIDGSLKTQTENSENYSIIFTREIIQIDYKCEDTEEE